MEFEFRVTAERRDHEQAQAIIADYWKKIGVRTNIKNMPNRLLNSADNRNRWPGAYIGSHNVTVEEWQERFHSKNIPTAENKYAPENVSGWNDPKKDAILDELELDHFARALGAIADRILQDVQHGAAASAAKLFTRSVGGQKRS